jgi:hypothetical protein
MCQLSWRKHMAAKYEPVKEHLKEVRFNSPVFLFPGTTATRLVATDKLLLWRESGSKSVFASFNGTQIEIYPSSVANVIAKAKAETGAPA